MNDRKRINGPSGGTRAPVFFNSSKNPQDLRFRPVRLRKPNALRKMFLRTGITPSASGSAYLEYELPPHTQGPTETPLSSLSSSGLKLICTVHGPRPLPRSAPFSPHILLTTHVKFAPFATRQRRGYIRDATERDLAVHIETALRGVIIGDRWPKSGVEVIVTILEGEEDRWWGEDNSSSSRLGAGGPWGLMSVLSGCVTVASAAIVDAGIDCVDVVSGGSAALIRDLRQAQGGMQVDPTLVLDPVPAEHHELLAACVVAYLPNRDEITDIWSRGNLEDTDYQVDEERRLPFQTLSDHAVEAAKGTHSVLAAALRESAELNVRG